MQNKTEVVPTEYKKNESTLDLHTSQDGVQHMTNMQWMWSDKPLQEHVYINRQ